MSRTLTAPNVSDSSVCATLVLLPNHEAPTLLVSLHERVTLMLVYDCLRVYIRRYRLFPYVPWLIVLKEVSNLPTSYHVTLSQYCVLCFDFSLTCGLLRRSFVLFFFTVFTLELTLRLSALLVLTHSQDLRAANTLSRVRFYWTTRECGTEKVVPNGLSVIANGEKV